MRASRYSISGMLVLVASIAIGFAALHTASAFWALGLLTVEYVLLVSSLLGIYFRAGRERAGWVGFAFFGWGFILLSMGPLALGEYGAPYASNNGPDQEEVRPILTPLEMTRQCLDLLALNRRPVPHLVGDTIQVRWRGLHYPAKVLDRAGFQVRSVTTVMVKGRTTNGSGPTGSGPNRSVTTTVSATHSRSWSRLASVPRSLASLHPGQLGPLAFRTPQNSATTVREMRTAPFEAGLALFLCRNGVWRDLSGRTRSWISGSLPRSRVNTRSCAGWVRHLRPLYAITLTTGLHSANRRRCSGHPAARSFLSSLTPTAPRDRLQRPDDQGARPVPHRVADGGVCSPGGSRRSTTLMNRTKSCSTTRPRPFRARAADRRAARVRAGGAAQEDLLRPLQDSGRDRDVRRALPRPERRDPCARDGALLPLRRA